MHIIISPYSRELNNKVPNPKNYPHWNEFIKLVKERFPDISTVQIGTNKEQRLELTDRFIADADVKSLIPLINESLCWLSVDNFFQHFCFYNKLKNGIVLWGQSDPALFGYATNVNLLKSPHYLRPNQGATWEEAVLEKDAFISAKLLFSIFERYTGLA